jgi:ankyrin repeat protein
MAIPPRSMVVIDGEFQRLKGIREICFDEDIITFLQDAQATLKYKGIYNQRGPSKRSLIHYAARGDCAELILYLLQDGTAKDDLDQNKRTPLSWVAQYSALRAVKILLDNGAEINSMDDMHTTPLSWLIQAGRGPNQAATIDYLRRNGATRRGVTRASIKRKIIQVFPSGLLK